MDFFPRGNCPLSAFSVRKIIVVIIAFPAFSYFLAPTDAATDKADVTALVALRSVATFSSMPKNWTGSDPCGDYWEGVICDGTAVTQLRISNVSLECSQLPSELGQLSNLVDLNLALNRGLTGSLPSSLGLLTKLTNLNIQGCSLTGSIPPEIGNLTFLYSIFLNDNKLSGTIPWTLGKLINLVWFDISSNSFSGEIPVLPGIETMAKVRHLHFQNNSFSGTVPSALSSLSNLMHLILENNFFSGDLPGSIANLPNVTIIAVGNNKFSSFPLNYSHLPKLQQLSAPNNSFSGALPNITNSTLLELDLSGNNFLGSIPTTFGTGLSNISTLNLANCNLTGVIPTTFGTLPTLKYLNVSNNKLQGPLPVNLNSLFTLDVADFSNNNFSGNWPTGLVTSNTSRWFSGNPICLNSSPLFPPCSDLVPFFIVDKLSSPCLNKSCLSGFPNPSNLSCDCSFPLLLEILFGSPPFQYISTSLVSEFVTFITPDVNLSPDQIQVTSVLTTSSFPIFEVAFFPSSGIQSLPFNIMSNITDTFSNHKILTGKDFGPLFLNSVELPVFVSDSSGPSLSSLDLGLIISGALIFVLLALSVSLIFYFRGKARAISQFEKQMEKHFCRKFTIVELSIATQNFDESTKLGQGGFATVFLGTAPNGEKWAIKRAKENKKEGLKVFQMEVEAISRLNHSNLLKLYGYCDEKHEQILVYEFCSNGNVAESLWRGKAPLSFEIRLKIAFGTASALEYLHNFSSPGIIHRDVKSDNILMDENFQAKLADFSLLKKIDQEGNVNSTNGLAGTPGYMDPEYYRTGEATVFSDVYSFGVVLFELITGKPPTFIDTEDPEEHISLAAWGFAFVNSGEEEKIFDPFLTSEDCPLEDLKSLAALASECVERSSENRPTMSEVVNRIGQLYIRKKTPLFSGYLDMDESERSVAHSYTMDGSYASSNPPISFMESTFGFASRD